MSRDMRFAVTVSSGLLAGILAIVWVRSHFRAEVISGTTQQRLYQIGYGQGKIAIGADYTRASFAPFHFDVLSTAIVSGADRNSALRLRRGVDVGKGDWLIAIPIWPMLLVATFVSVAPWCHFQRQFSLRTLLIVTTLAALLIGLAVWLTPPA
jgi:hypothetical protein